MSNESSKPMTEDEWGKKELAKQDREFRVAKGASKVIGFGFLALWVMAGYRFIVGKPIIKIGNRK